MLFGQEPWSFDVALPAGSKNISLACTDAGTQSLIDYGNWVEAGFVERVAWGEGDSLCGRYLLVWVWGQSAACMRVTDLG